METKGGASGSNLDPTKQGINQNDELINGPSAERPEHGSAIKRVVLIVAGLLLASLLGVALYMVFFKPSPQEPAPAAEPKPVTSYIKIEGDSELSSLNYGSDYTVQYAGPNYLVNVLKSPKRVIYNGKEVYRGEDISSTALSGSGKYWALETRRTETRAKRDENTKIVQQRAVDVSTLTVNDQRWGERDDSRLLSVTDNGAPVLLTQTGKQTPSQYGEALEEEVIYFGESEKFKTSYGITNFEMSSDGSNWLVTTASPNTKEVYDFFVSGTKKNSLDARILARLDIDTEGNYLVAFCQEKSDSLGIGLIGKDCQISVNGKTRTTIFGTVYLASTLGEIESYAGVDKELRQSFVKNIRQDLIVEQRKDLDVDPAAPIGVYLNGSGDKSAVTTSLVKDGKLRVTLSINGQNIENTISGASLFGFGPGDDDQTLFIYELPVKSSS